MIMCSLPKILSLTRGLQPLCALKKKKLKKIFLIWGYTYSPTNIFEQHSSLTYIFNDTVEASNHWEQEKENT